MAKDIVLINVNTYQSPYPVFPLGICYIASALERAGYSVHIFDRAVDNGRFLDEIRRIQPSYVGLSLRNIDDIQIESPRFLANDLLNTTRQIRECTKAVVILGGSGYSLFPDELLEKSGADFGITGEGEGSLVSLLESLQNSKDYNSISGLVYRRNGTVKINGRSLFSEGNIPSPLLPSRLVSHYLKKSTMLNIQTQRGCAYKCSYCTYPLIEGRRVRRRQAGEVCDDIEAAARAGAGYLFIVDSVFNTSSSHLVGVCEEIIRRNINIKWGCFLRPKALTKPLMHLMARAGISHIEFGTDSLSNKMLENYDKGFTVDEVIRASEYARKEHLHYAHFLIVGGPGETEKTIRESYANSRHIKRTVFFPYIGVRVYPRTKLHLQALKEGAVDKDTNLLAPFFYVTPHVSRQKIARMLANYHRENLNWIVGDITQTHGNILKGLRRLGVVGPMWEYIVR